MSEFTEGPGSDRARGRGPRETAHRARARVHTTSPRAAFRHVSSGRSRQNRAVDAVTRFSGSLPFVYLHVLWFVGWIAVNTGALGAHAEFDEFPFGLLTLVVSLEAIFLSTFVLISQNRQTVRTQVQTRLNYEADVRAEIWTVRIGDMLGLDPDQVEAEVQEALDANRRTIDEQTTG